MLARIDGAKYKIVVALMLVVLDLDAHACANFNTQNCL